MYENNPEEFLIWYYKRFVSYKDVKPNSAHYWLSDKKLITQNIDGLDGKAGNHNYISIHGRLDKVIVYKDEMEIQIPFNASWDNLITSKNYSLELLKQKLLKKFNINIDENLNFRPEKNISLKPYVLLFDEMYTEVYRISEAEYWMASASKIIFIGTSFSVNITSIALRKAISMGIDIEIVDPEPIKINYENVTYNYMTAEEYCDMRKLNN